MKPNIVALVLLVLTPAVIAPLHAQELSDPERAALSEAESWLALIDAGELAESWAETAPIFRENVTETQWAQAAATVSSQTGAFESRSLQGVVHAPSIPNAPPGEYMIVQFASTYARVPAAEETVILRQEGEDGWKVAGYFVAPAQ